MKEHTHSLKSIVNWYQLAIGAAGLLLGIALYLIDRPPDQTFFVFSSPVNISLYKILPNLFGYIGNSLPAFIHVFSFILITASLTSFRKKGYLIICTLWFSIDFVFELGQAFKETSVGIIPAWFTHFPFLENARKFFLNGTFDWVDIGFICLGAITAYIVLVLTCKVQRRCFNDKR